MPQSLTSPPKKVAIAVKRESGFYKQVKEAAQRVNRKLLLTRIENWVGAGIPDVVLCDSSGYFHFVELKYTTSNRVDLRPSQVAWLTKHRHASCWILIKKQAKPTERAEMFLYKAEDAVDLKMEGMKDMKPVFRCSQPFKWEDMFFKMIGAPDGTL